MMVPIKLHNTPGFCYKGMHSNFITVPVMCLATVAEKIIAKQSLCTQFTQRLSDQQGIVKSVLLHSVPLCIPLSCSALCLKSHPGIYPWETFSRLASV